MSDRTVLLGALVVACLCLPAQCSPAPPATTVSPPARGAARLLYGLPLDPNTATADDLEALPGIGAARARAIEAERPYCSLADLRRVRGIGPTILSRLGPHLQIRAVSRGCEAKLR